MIDLDLFNSAILGGSSANEAHLRALRATIDSLPPKPRHHIRKLARALRGMARDNGPLGTAALLLVMLEVAVEGPPKKAK